MVGYFSETSVCDPKSEEGMYEPGFCQPPVMSKPSGVAAVQGSEPLTKAGFRSSSAPRAISVSPFAGALAFGPPTVSEPADVAAVAAVASVIEVALTTAAM